MRVSEVGWIREASSTTPHYHSKAIISVHAPLRMPHDAIALEVMSNLRSTQSPVALATVALCVFLSGCVDETRVRELTDNMIRAREAAFFTRRAQHARELATTKDCCDDLMKVRPHGRADAAQPFRTSPGLWPSTQVMEMLGARSYYVLVEFSPIESDTARLRVASGLSVGRYHDTNSRMDGAEIFVPVAAFLDRDRQLIEITGARAPALQSPTESVFHIDVPRGASFAAIYTNPEALALTGMSATIPASTGAYPIGGVTVVTRTSAQQIALLPARVGSISASID